jgi:hypothetical protein
MGLFSKGPSAGDIARAQGSANKQAATESARLSAVDQFSPFGSTTFTRRPDGTPASQTISLSPELQRTLDAQFGTAGLAAEAGQNLAGQLPTEAFSLNDVGSGGDVRDAYYQEGLSLLQPEMDRQRSLMDIKFSERGIPIGSEIYNDETNRYETQRDQSLGSLARNAILAGGAEQDRLIRNALTERTQGINEIAALTQGAPALPTPSFAATPGVNVQPANIGQAYQIANSAQQGAKGGLGSLALGAGSLFL